MGSKDSTSTSKSSWGPPKWLGERYRTLLDKTDALSDSPYQAYTGQRVADFNADQNAAFSGVRGAQGLWQPYFDKASTYAEQAARPTYQTFQDYLNPYTQNVVDATQRQFASNNKEQQNQILGNAVLKGAMGGDRVSVAQAETARQQKLAQDPVIANLYSQGYDKAIGAAQADSSRYLSAADAMRGLGLGSQGATYTDLGQLFGMGNTQQAHDQTGLDVNYKDFIEQRAYPFQQMQWQAGLYGGLGPLLGGKSSSETTTPGPDPLSQIAGLGLAAGGMMMGNPGLGMAGLSMAGGGGGGGAAAAPAPQTGPFYGSGGQPAFTPWGFADGGAVNGLSRPYATGGAVLPYGAPDDDLGMDVRAMPTGHFEKPNLPQAPAPKPDEGLSASIEPFLKKMASRGDQGLGGAVEGQRPQGLSLPVDAVQSTGDRSQPRGFRNNNPGNIEDGAFAKALPGYVGSDGRFARFANMDHGMGAADALLQSYAKKGITTPAGIINRWAPASDGNPVAEYAKHVAGGADPDAPVDMTDPAVRRALAQRMFSFENGRAVPGYADGGYVEDEGDEYFDDGTMSPDDTAPQPFSPPTSSGLGAGSFVAPTQPTQKSGGLGSPELSRALVAAGFGMMASKSPHVGQALGEGGLMGLKTYDAALADNRKQEVATRNADLAAQRLAQSARQASERLAETKRHNTEVEGAGRYTIQPGEGPDPNDPEKKVPGAWKLNAKTGEMEFKAGVSIAKGGKDPALEREKLQLKRDEMDKKYGQGNYTLEPGIGPNAEGENVSGLWTFDKKTGKKTFEPDITATRKADPYAKEKLEQRDRQLAQREKDSERRFGRGNYELIPGRGLDPGGSGEMIDGTWRHNKVTGEKIFEPYTEVKPRNGTGARDPARTREAQILVDKGVAPDFESAYKIVRAGVNDNQSYQKLIQAEKKILALQPSNMAKSDAEIEEMALQNIEKRGKGAPAAKPAPAKTEPKADPKPEPAKTGALKAPPPELLERARQAIAAKKDPEAVKQRLRDNGFDPSGL